MDGADFLLRLVNSTRFELCIVFLIIINCMTDMLEAQYMGYNVGHDLGYPGYNTSASQLLPWVESMLKVTPIIFTIIFLIEWFLRVGAYKLDSWKHPALAFDMLLILISGADLIAAGLFAGVNPGAVRCIRILKLLRMIKILRTFSWMSSLFLIVRSITQASPLSCGPSLSWHSSRLVWVLSCCKSCKLICWTPLKNLRKENWCSNILARLPGHLSPCLRYQLATGHPFADSSWNK